ncbi:MAG TPA: undecaprenyl-diphosphate phosphatase [Candidatus Latescibacteria bacterium]|nr:undecaprenyl-diphosphate phosphatase [Candidatus Latescibacterota bacterium]HOS63565.1 undecaprenyl-diphosphate phosphatase [Candidatus Latescibacterota bacterium]HPK73315.1 undecaprenyl-diphosphate phosphatase [Candidatus Latescibacterota bacterium]
MSVSEAAIVGVIQGMTEFLPVSSSAHIVYAEHFLGIKEGNVDLAIVVHLGTLVAVFGAMWYRIAPIIRGTIAGVADLAVRRSPWAREEFRWAAYIIVGTVPAALLGVLFEDSLKETFGNPFQTSVLLIGTGIILFATRFVRRNDRDWGLSPALAVGFAQALAILPGISRSGSTISMGLFLRIEREKAAEFSFLLSIPVILGGAIIHIAGMVEQTGGLGLLSEPLIAGFCTSAISGYAAVRVLVSFVKKGALHWFAVYCWIVGAAGMWYFA